MQGHDLQLIKLKEIVHKSFQNDLNVKDNGVLIVSNRFCVPNIEGLKNEIMA